ncbi:MAG: phosphatase PAP2 family protein [Planctomycetota bacterium]
MADASEQLGTDPQRHQLSTRLRVVGAVLIVVSLGLWAIESGFGDARSTTSKFWHYVRAVGWDLPELIWFWELASQAVARDALIALLALVALLLGSRRKIQLLFLVPIISGIVVNLLKVIACRARPHGDIGSWPSGHASSAFALFVVALVLKFRGFRLFAGFVVLAAWSRVMLERHWPADLVASLGVVCVCTSYAIRLPVLMPRWVGSPRFLAFLAGIGWLRSAIVFPFEDERSIPNLAWALLLWSATLLIALQRIADHEVRIAGRRLVQRGVV